MRFAVLVSALTASPTRPHPARARASPPRTSCSAAAGPCRRPRCHPPGLTRRQQGWAPVAERRRWSPPVEDRSAWRTALSRVDAYRRAAVRPSGRAVPFRRPCGQGSPGLPADAQDPRLGSASAPRPAGRGRGRLGRRGVIAVTVLLSVVAHGPSADPLAVRYGWAVAVQSEGSGEGAADLPVRGLPGRRRHHHRHRRGTA